MTDTAPDIAATASGDSCPDDLDRPTNGHRFTAAEKDAAMIALALQNGNAARASRVLAEDGISVSESTLKNWKGTPAYATICAGVMGPVRQALAARYEEAAALAIDKTNDALEAFTIEGLKPPDVAGAARNLMTTAAVAQDKANVLRDQPTEIREIRSGADILASIQRRAPNLIVDNEAEGDDPNITDAEVVPALPPAA